MCDGNSSAFPADELLPFAEKLRVDSAPRSALRALDVDAGYVVVDTFERLRQVLRRFGWDVEIDRYGNPHHFRFRFSVRREYGFTERVPFASNFTGASVTSGGFGYFPVGRVTLFRHFDKAVTTVGDEAGDVGELVVPFHVHRL